MSAEGSEQRAQGLTGAVLVGALAAVISAVGSLMRSKSSALALGPEGVGVVAEVQQLLALVQFPVTTLVGAGLTKSLVDAHAAGPELMRQRVRDAISAALVVSSVSCIIGGLAAPWVLGDAVPRPFVTFALAGCGAIAVSALSVYAQALTIWRRFTNSSMVTSTNVFVSAVGSSVLVFFFGVDGIFIGLLIGPFVAFPLALHLVSRWGGVGNWLPSGRVAFASLATAMRIGAAALVGSVVTQLALSVMRLTLIEKGGNTLHGLFQSAWALDMLFTGLLTTGLSSYFFPRFAAAQSTDALQTEVVAAARFMLRAGVPAVVLFAASRHLLLLLAYSSAFSSAAIAVGLFAVGDALKLIGWVSSAPLLYLGNVRAFMVTESVAAGTLALASWLLIPRWGLMGAGAAQVAMYFVYLLVTRFVLWRTLRVAVPLSLPLSFIGAAGGLAVLVWATERYVLLSLVGVSLAVLMAWRAGAWTLVRRWFENRRGVSS